MKNLKRFSFRHSLMLGIAVAQLALAADASGDGIARPPGAVDGRGWELVSRVDTNDAQIFDGSAVLSNDGNRVLFALLGGAPGTTSGARVQMLAVRTSTGWVSHLAMPPRTAMVADGYAEVAATPDLARWVASAQDGLGTSDSSPDVSLVQLDDQGDQTVLHTFPVFFSANVLASDDLDHVFADVPERIAPSHHLGTMNVYDVGSGTPQLVSIMPSTGNAPACGVTVAEFVNGTDGTTGTHWVSTDGSQVFFKSRGDAPGCAGPSRLYVRDRRVGLTSSISGPALSGDTEVDADLSLLQAAADGSWVIYRTATSLDPADDTDGSSTDLDVYKWTAGVGSQCLTCVVANADVQPGPAAAAAAHDGSHVYFASMEVLGDAPSGTPAGTADAPNLYVLSGGSVHFIARTSRGPGVVNNARQNGYLTPDGNVLVFIADRPELNAITGSDNGGLLQVYRYDDRRRGDAHGGLSCVSCAPGGAPTPDAVFLDGLVLSTQAVMPDLRAATDDGRSVFFVTSTALVTDDVNQGADIYEWHDGVAKLITDGVTRRKLPAIPQFNGVSADGRDALFRDAARLTWDAQGTLYKEYDARIGGGFAAPPPQKPPCDGEQCRPRPAAPPLLSDPASSMLSGSGNVKPPPSFSVRRVTAAQRARLAATGRLTLTVRVSGGGRVSAFAQATVGRRVRIVARAGEVPHGRTVKLTLRLSHAARSQLTRTGRLRLVVAIRYAKAPAAKRLTLRLDTPRSGRGR